MEATHRNRMPIRANQMVGYFFHWQTSRRLAEAALLRGGAEPQAAAWYDNSKANPHDPDAQADLRRGEQRPTTK